MRKHLKLAVILGVSAGLAPACEARAQQTALPAPLPAQITSGKKVFVSNAGGDSNGLYSGEPRRLYDQFYAALKSWGRYELVGNPAQADLVFEIGFTNPFVGENVSGGHGVSVSSHSVNDPQFRLVIFDPGTRVILWVFTEHIAPALLQGNRDKNFDQALSFLVNDLRNVAGQPVAVVSNDSK
ncbi:MAG TPA: hypothetical protein VJN92_15190 [Candidatus Acidoferrum sp.]|nr:hypothetical protein [Candidatus Acidoferrum sp.]